MICRASFKPWIIRRMKASGLPQGTLVKYWKTGGRIQLEACTSVWQGSISKAQPRALEKVQRLELSTITSWTLE